MPIDRSYVGREYPASTTYEVGREHVRAFADAIGDPNPLYRDRAAAQAAGHPDVVAPPTFLTVLTNRFGAEGPVADPGLGLDYSLVVHGEQHFALHRPVVVGDVLSTTVRISDVREIGRNESLTLLTEVTGAGGAPVATMTTTLVSRGTAAPRTPDQER